MKKLLSMFLGKEKKDRRSVVVGGAWMRTQLVRMNKMNQGVISMSGGK